MAEKPDRKPRFSWSPPRFVALPENRSALLAIRRLAHCLGRRCSFVPLVLHGPPGTGKSHLADALYVFADPHYSCRRLNAGEWPRWDDDAPHDEFRNCDLLVIEDLQHLPAWAANSLAEILDQRIARGRSTLITAGRGPAELENLPARLTSRLTSGLVIGLEALGVPSRRMLLQKWAAARNVSLSDEALNWLAAHVPASGRQLLAVAVRLRESAAATPGPLELAEVQQVIEPDSELCRPSLEKIGRLVGMRFGVELRQLRSPDRHPNLVWPRQLTMHLARSLTTLSLAQIGEFFGRDHSTVRHACQKVDDALAIDAELPGLLRELSAELC